MKFPMQYFKVMVHHFANFPEWFAPLLAGTDLTVEEVLDDKFEVTVDQVWKLCENVRSLFGAGWYVNFPLLWKSELDGAFETAIRVAPTLRDVITILERFGTQRWPFARWDVKLDQKFLNIYLKRTTAVPAPEWEMMTSGFRLRMNNILKVGFPQLVPHWREMSEYPCPIDEDVMREATGLTVEWNAPVTRAFLPIEYLDVQSVVADRQSFARLLEALETESGPINTTWVAKVTNLLGDSDITLLNANSVAELLGLSVRSLGRRLSDEGATFAQLRDNELADRFRRMCLTGHLGLAEIADRLGYCDESALSKATRRWFGCSAADARGRFRS